MRRLYLYLHTHWDREWYRPFEDFRTDLVGLVRTVCDSLEQGVLPNFNLDGQACVLEDVTQVSPELLARITSLMQVGRLSAGPWYVLADQMLVSGESLVRNLKLGLSLTGKFGQPALVGYCPDTFGHSQDLPRILSGFGIKCAVVWRGVPPLDQPAFWWESPDGSRVLAYHLRRGYYQTAFHEGRPASELQWFLLSWLERQGQHQASTFDAPIQGALVPVGADHLTPPRDIASTLAQIREILTPADESADAGQSDIRIQPVLLADFFKERDTIAGSVGPAVTVSGELRDNSGAALFERA
jgi:alpha-mannosidase/mannosylglycerate hydrolase